MTHPFPVEAADRRLIAMKYWLLGQNMNDAIRYLEYNRPFFSGKRKDGITPEFDHHICQAQFARTLLPFLIEPEVTFGTIFCHDTLEDIGISQDEIKKVAMNPMLGERVAECSWKMTKTFRGERRRDEEVFDAIGNCPVTSIAKGIDRIHNFQTMVGVFSSQKQMEYIKEGEDFFLPMLKHAEKKFPEQEPAYKNIRTFLKSQIQLILLLNEK